MKKKISLLLCMLAAVLVFLTGCGSSNDQVQYDEATVEQVAEFMITYCSGVDDETVAQLRSLRESTFEQELADAGLPVTPDNFLSAMDAWDAGEEECGAYLEHGDYTIKVDSDEVVVQTEAEFEDRSATVEFVFDEDMYLESLTVSAHFTMGEIVKKAALNTLLGMGTVFVVLILISLIISLFRFIPDIQRKFQKKPEDAKAQESEPVQVVESSQSPMEDLELVAVIAAAIAAAEGTSTDDFVVRSIKRRTSNKWNSI